METKKTSRAKRSPKVSRGKQHQSLSFSTDFPDIVAIDKIITLGLEQPQIPIAELEIVAKEVHGIYPLEVMQSSRVCPISRVYIIWICCKLLDLLMTLVKMLVRIGLHIISMYFGYNVTFVDWLCWILYVDLLWHLYVVLDDFIAFPMMVMILPFDASYLWLAWDIICF
jgi:hypothetical protein